MRDVCSAIVKYTMNKLNEGNIKSQNNLVDQTPDNFLKSGENKLEPKTNLGNFLLSFKNVKEDDKKFQNN